MKKVFLAAVVTILCSAMYTSCTPEALTNEDETEISVVDPADDGQVDEEDHRETGFSDPDEEPDPDDRG